MTGVQTCALPISGALKSTNDARDYARKLQEAGYATDPHYADKLAATIDGKSLRHFGPT